MTARLLIYVCFNFLRRPIAVLAEQSKPEMDDELRRRLKGVRWGQGQGRCVGGLP